MNAVWYALIMALTAALGFAVVNGIRDAAHSIATVASTRVLSPRLAVLWAACFNLLAMFVFAPKVANTMANLVRVEHGDRTQIWVVLAGLVGAIGWDLVSSRLGVPSSSSHAVMGGLIGAAVSHAGWSAIQWSQLLPALVAVPVAPVLGFGLGLGAMLALSLLFQRWRPGLANGLFRRGQLLSSALYSLGHGANDAQKAAGVVAALLVAAGVLDRSVKLSLFEPKTLWIIVSCHVAIALGTAWGGFSVLRSARMRILKLAPVGGFCTDAAGFATLAVATCLGIPISTTHTLTGSAVGVGSTSRFSLGRWGVVGGVIWVWAVTIPVAGAISAAFLSLVRFVGPLR